MVDSVARWVRAPGAMGLHYIPVRCVVRRQVQRFARVDPIAPDGIIRAEAFDDDKGRFRLIRYVDGVVVALL